MDFEGKYLWDQGGHRVTPSKAAPFSGAKNMVGAFFLMLKHQATVLNSSAVRAEASGYPLWARVNKMRFQSEDRDNRCRMQTAWAS